ncbi:MAG: hypothetical protein ACI976_001686, partial [Aureispira sp.]
VLGDLNQVKSFQDYIMMGGQPPEEVQDTHSRY